MTTIQNGGLRSEPGVLSQANGGDGFWNKLRYCEASQSLEGDMKKTVFIVITVLGKNDVMVMTMNHTLCSPDNEGPGR
jgi:hypothetical protein